MQASLQFAVRAGYQIDGRWQWFSGTGRAPNRWDMEWFSDTGQTPSPSNFRFGILLA
jgi:hypothetical protein